MKNIEHPPLHQLRQRHLANELWSDWFMELMNQLDQVRQQGEQLCPAYDQIFAACNHTPLDSIRVVIVWQDPYHGPGQAHWVAFSVPDGVRCPPSLRNIFKELHDDCGIEPPQSGNLLRRAEQWVFLLNSCLTVSMHKPASHAHLWRERLTDRMIQLVADQCKHCVFLLRWAFAQSKQHLIDAQQHLILTASHPSPFSARRWFFGSQHFSQTNNRLISHGYQPIDR